MAFEYNGVVYRDLEPQVRYDAEQVQLLKQADVTINENIQTINTEINGKLTKPTNPSAESAVTMLANGTVGTKPLSEIGRKLYMHNVRITITSISAAKQLFHLYDGSEFQPTLTGNPEFSLIIYNNSTESIKKDTLKDNLKTYTQYIVKVFIPSSPSTTGICSLTIDNGSLFIVLGVIQTEGFKIVSYDFTDQYANCIDSVSDVVTEL